MAKAYGYTVVGLEISAKRIQYAQSNGISTIPSLAEVIGQKFHYIYANQVFEHIPNLVDTLKTLTEHLSDDGLVCISVPNGDSVLGELQRSQRIFHFQTHDPINPLEHINCFTYQTLAQLGKMGNLKLTPQSELRKRIVDFIPIPSTRLPKFRGLTLYFQKNTK
jgi:2-polyprenyl-3-methyl-5-hydroxy-6-metoxy-1,4-benzoquinol methylase